MTRALALFLVVFMSPLGMAPVLAQGYPDKPIRLIVGYPPGGGTDVVARIITPKLSEFLGQSVVIENRPGATGVTAAGFVAKSPPDGYMLMMGHVSINAIAPSVFAKLPYDAAKDFAPIILTASVPHFIVVQPSLPVRSIKELIALAKAEPGKLTFPSAGNASTPHLAGEMFKTMAGVDMVHIPYKGSGPAVTDLVGGQVNLMFDNLPSSIAQIKAGKLRAIAVTTLKRSPALPDVPTIAESGLPGYDASSWFGMHAPAGTSKDIVNKIYGVVSKSLRTPEMTERLATQGAEAVGNTPEEFSEFVRAEIAKWAKVVKASGARVD